MQIITVDHTSPHLVAVKVLGRNNAGTLGLFPGGAFDDYAYRKHILVALDSDGKCAGYLLYRISRRWALIVHLCVAEPYRGNGVARRLVDQLCADTQHLLGIRADCRRDYVIRDMWPRLGFYATGERPGRAQAGSVLTIWRLNHGHPDLFTEITMEQLESKILVAIDANIFYDLIDDTRPDRDESLALLADWLSDDIELAVSDELWNEIDRGKSEAQRQRARAAATEFHHFQSTRSAFDDAQHSLRRLFPEDLNANDESDLRQLARAVAGHIPYFVTRDEALLDRANDVYQVHGIAIRRPSDLVIQLDELRRQQEYQPARLAGTHIELRRVQSQEQSTLTEYFQHGNQGETRGDFGRLLRRLLSDPSTIECLVVRDTSGAPILLAAYDRSQAERLSVPLLRVRRGPLAPTLLRYFLLQSVAHSTCEGRQVTVISDPVPDPLLINALRQDTFTQLASGDWAKVHLPMAAPIDDLSRALQRLTITQQPLARYVQQLVERLNTPGISTDVTSTAEIERLLWPAKIIDSRVYQDLLIGRPGIQSEPKVV